jgi:hypothetical protein
MWTAFGAEAATLRVVESFDGARDRGLQLGFTFFGGDDRVGERGGKLRALSYHLILHDRRRRVTEAKRIESASSKHSQSFARRFREPIERGRIEWRLARVRTARWPPYRCCTQGCDADDEGPGHVLAVVDHHPTRREKREEAPNGLPHHRDGTDALVAASGDDEHFTHTFRLLHPQPGLGTLDCLGCRRQRRAEIQRSGSPEADLVECVLERAPTHIRQRIEERRM